MTDIDISIIGGGAVGLITALALSHLDCKIICIEKNSINEMLKDRRCIALSYSSILILDNLGIWSKIIKKTTLIKHINVSEKGCFSRVVLNSSDENIKFLGATIAINELIKELIKVLSLNKNIALISESITSISSVYNDCYSLNVLDKNNNNKTINSKLIIAADGAYSKVRNFLQIPTDIHDYKQKAIVFDIVAGAHFNNWAFERFLGDGVLAILPKKDNTLSCIWTLSLEKSFDILQKNDTDFIKIIEAILPVNFGRITSISERQSFPLKLLKSQELYKSNILLFGNASHSLHPIAGQGLNLSIRDTGILYDCIKKYGIEKNNLNGLLEAYKKLREDDHKRAVFLTHGLIYLFLNGNTSKKLLRSFGLHSLERMPFFKKTFSRLMMGSFSQNSTLMYNDRL